MQRFKPVMRKSWVWAACAALPLALVGCQGNRPAANTNQPADQRVAGERQEEPSAEVRAAIQQAGLPETFAFGGRIWRGHEIHRVERDKVAMTAPGTAGTAPGPRGAAPNPQKPQEGQNPFDFTPVADLKVQDHQIYRKAGLDEAVTDNIFLMASNMGAQPSGTTGSTGASGNTPGTTGGESAAGEENQVTFIEYDATETAPTMDLAQALQATGLPQTIQVGGRTLTAREVQVYDPDVFDEFGKVQSVQGHSAYQGDEKDELVLMAEPSTPGTTGTGTTPGTGDQATETPGTPGEATAMSGPLFIRYEEGTSAGGTGAGNAPGAANAPGPGRTP